ncbi:MAG: type IV pilin protein, partial [Thiohalobacterales bacterium]|nr:type IV pilin protein [Thiohalobacterales bacterium]
RMEMYYTDHKSYEGAALGWQSGSIFPPTTEDGFYRLAITRQDAGYYSISAAPTSRGNQQTDRCGTFTLDSLGNRGAAGLNCWR